MGKPGRHGLFLHQHWLGFLMKKIPNWYSETSSGENMSSSTHICYFMRKNKCLLYYAEYDDSPVSLTEKPCSNVLHPCLILPKYSLTKAFPTKIVSFVTNLADICTKRASLCSWPQALSQQSNSNLLPPFSLKLTMLLFFCQSKRKRMLWKMGLWTQRYQFCGDLVPCLNGPLR